MQLCARSTPPRQHRPRSVACAILLLLALVSRPGLGRAASGLSVVTGSIVTSKASLSDGLIYTFVNCQPFAVTFNYGVTLLPQLIQTGGAPPAGSLNIPAQSYASIQLVVQILPGTTPGLFPAPLNWTNVTTLETGAATAAIQTRPFDEYSPTLFSTPNPRVLILGPGSVATLAGCRIDSAGFVPRWRIIGDDSLFAYATTVTNPVPAGALMSVSNGSGSLPIPAGPPAAIIQTITPPVGPDPIVVNEVTVTLAAPSPGGPIPGVAVSRYTVIYFNPGPVPAETRRWSEIKRLYAP